MITERTVVRHSRLHIDRRLYVCPWTGRLQIFRRVGIFVQLHDGIRAILVIRSYIIEIRIRCTSHLKIGITGSIEQTTNIQSFRDERQVLFQLELCVHRRFRIIFISLCQLGIRVRVFHTVIVQCITIQHVLGRRQVGRRIISRKQYRIGNHDLLIHRITAIQWTGVIVERTGQTHNSLSRLCQINIYIRP